jgi:hypothetical protein
MIVIFKENATYDVIRAGPETNYREDENVPMKLPAGRLRKIFLQSGAVAVIVENDARFFVYSAQFSLFEPMNRWTIQCEVPHVCDIGIHPPVLYVLHDGGISGCAFDSTMTREFPRALTSIAAGSFRPLRTFTDFAVVNVDTHELSLVKGRNIKRIALLTTEKLDFQELFLIGNRLFKLALNALDVFDAATGGLVMSKAVDNTERWLTSFEQSFGAVFVGARSFTVSKSEIAPLVNLAAPKRDLVELMRKANKNVGSVAAGIVLVADRSPYLVVTLAEQEIEKELSMAAPQGTIQSHVAPILARLNVLMRDRPV